MKVEDAKRIPWRRLRNWDGLTATCRDWDGVYVREADVDNFLAGVNREISQKLNVPYEQVEAIMLEENEVFYSTKREMFSKGKGSVYSRNSQKMKQLKCLFRVPDLTLGCMASDEERPLVACLELYEKLSDTERLVFLQKIGKVSIKVKNLD